MNLLYSQISKREIIDYNSTLSQFNLNDNSILKKINGIYGTLNIDKVSDIVTITCNLTCDVEIVSSYTMKEFRQKIHLDDSLYFSNNEEFESDDVMYVKEEIDIDQYIYSLLITSIPINAHKKGEKLITHGKNFEVIKEENLKRDESENIFDSLKDIDFDK
ncbi:MAG: hypothetical protein WCR97_01590 [Bacilli bacterium]